MKTLLIIGVTLLIAVSCSTKTFHGSIIYKVSYDIPKNINAEAPPSTEIKNLIGDGFTRIEQQSRMGDQVSLYFWKEKKTVILTEIMGKKMALTSNDSEDNATYFIEEKKETKKIAGYKCNLANFYAIRNGDSTLFQIYYTPSITGEANSQFPGLKGYPLSYSTKEQGVTINCTATEIKEKEIDSTLKSIPEEYEVMTMKDFMDQMGQGK